MLEKNVVRLVRDDPAPHTDFNAPYWDSVDPGTLEACFNKGFIRWDDKGKLVVTPLGKRSCGGDTNERHH